MEAEAKVEGTCLNTELVALKCEVQIRYTCIPPCPVIATPLSKLQRV